MNADVVAELDRWRTTPRTAETAQEFVPIGELLQRARDEIVALRKLTDGDWVWQQITSTRDDALEDAAALCLRKARDHVIPIGQDNYHDGCLSCAGAIRALKARP